MSLRIFHIVFVSASVLMCLVSGVMIGLLAFDESWAIPGMAASAVSAGVLLLYGRSFLRRMSATIDGKGRA
jgi:hypothetical protein